MIRDSETTCPYCGARLSLIPSRWYGREVLTCEQCGDFPDFSARPSLANTSHQYRPRVLLVDDSAAHLELYRSLLDGLAVPSTTTDGEEAIALAREEHFDAVVLDKGKAAAA
jgi:hypothetical protein